MDTKVIRIEELEANLRGNLEKCYNSGEALVVELPGHGLLTIQPADEDDDLVNELIEHNEAFRAMLAKSAVSPRKPFRPMSVKEE
jgi:hypothetical protein